ncbi:MAG TPA: TetR/AcrR family transcriptional regulator [Candidatus Elarobacter sp.]
MARTADDERRAELLERIVDYVMEHGLADLSLRPLADAVDSSPRVLLYYFGSKDELVAELLGVARARQLRAFSKLPRNAATYRETVRAAWAVMSAPENTRLFRLFFEVYGLALQQPDRFPGFFARAIDDWIAYLEPSPRADGHTPADARAIATILLAGYRGFLLDFAATNDRRRLNRAVEIWIAALDAIPSPQELADARRRR